jgi:hypothetical protein
MNAIGRRNPSGDIKYGWSLVYDFKIDFFLGIG